MANANPLDILTPVEKQALAAEYMEKIKQARDEEANLQRRITELRSTISRWGEFIDLLSVKHDTESGDTLFYNRHWTKGNKALFAAKNPQIIGKKSLAGAHDFVAVIQKVEPELLGADNPEVGIQRFSALLSNLAWKGKMKKMREKQNKVAIHYFDLSWFDGDTLKPEYNYLLDTLEYIPTSQSKQESSDSDSQDNLLDEEEETEQKKAPAEAGAD